MMYVDNGVLVKEDATVEITAMEYAHLVIIANRYQVIKDLAFKDPGLNWKNEIELNGEDVCEYIKFVERDKVAVEENLLRVTKAKQEGEK